MMMVVVAYDLTLNRGCFEGGPAQKRGYELAKITVVQNRTKLNKKKNFPLGQSKIIIHTLKILKNR